MSLSKEVLKKHAAAPKARLKKSAAVQEQLRLDHEQAAREAADLWAAVDKHISEPTTEPLPPTQETAGEPPIVLHRSMWQKFLDSF